MRHFSRVSIEVLLRLLTAVVIGGYGNGRSGQRDGGVSWVSMVAEATLISQSLARWEGCRRLRGGLLGAFNMVTL
jgi:hypothetical protein